MVTIRNHLNHWEVSVVGETDVVILASGKGKEMPVWEKNIFPLIASSIWLFRGVAFQELYIMNRATEEHSKIVDPVREREREKKKHNTIAAMNCSHASSCEDLDESL